MYANNFEQLKSFVIFAIIGLIISIIFDMFRISRKVFKTPDILTYVEDTCFWLITGFIMLFSIFIFNNGELRLYIFIGIFIGVLLYMIFISKYFIKINVTIINLIKNIISKILHILIKPFKVILHILRITILKPISFIFINFRSFFTKFINKPKNIKENLDKNEGI